MRKKSSWLGSSGITVWCRTTRAIDSCEWGVSTTEREVVKQSDKKVRGLTWAQRAVRARRKRATSDDGWPIHESAAISSTTMSTGEKLGVGRSEAELGSRQAPRRAWTVDRTRSRSGRRVEEPFGGTSRKTSDWSSIFCVRFRFYYK